jgi:hypothetical protein
MIKDIIIPLGIEDVLLNAFELREEATSALVSGKSGFLAMSLRGAGEPPKLRGSVPVE